MKTAKIVKIGNIKEWSKEWFWTTFYISLELDNNETITLWKKKQDAFKVWDTVSYEVVEEWKRWREVKENNFKPRYNPESNNRWAMVWMAIKLAFDKVYQWEDDFEKASYLSQRVFDLAMSMYNSAEWESKKEEVKETENDDLPF